MISCIGLIEPKNIKFYIYLNFIKKNARMRNAPVKKSYLYIKKMRIKILESKYSTGLLMSLSDRS